MNESVMVGDSELAMEKAKSVFEYVQSHVQAKIELVEMIRIPAKCATMVVYRLAQD